MTDAAALLHRQRRVFHARENGAEVVLDLAEHKAVEQGDAAPGAGAGEDASRRQEAEIGDGVVEARGPLIAHFLPPFSVNAAARATRQKVSSSDASIAAPSGDFRRYLRSQMSREMGAENSASLRIGASCCSAHKYGSERVQSQ